MSRNWDGATNLQPIVRGYSSHLRLLVCMMRCSSSLLSRVVRNASSDSTVRHVLLPDAMMPEQWRASGYLHA